MKQSSDDVTIVGLGAMGATLADLFLKQGARVTVWNRSADKARDLLARGAQAAPDITSAIAASAVIVMCVSNDDAVREILRSPGAGDAFAGRTLVQLTTIAPATARDGDRWARDHGGHYLAGAIQAAPSQMGQPDTPILMSGDGATWERTRALLAALGGGLVYLGADPARPRRWTWPRCRGSTAR